jgi:hypothetical protein
MRTKQLLLATAALAAGLVSSQAQTTVYSVNVVGYANVALPGNGKYTLLANPFDDGNGNNVTNLLNTALPKQSQVLTWNGSSFSFLTKGGTPANFPAGTTLSLPPGVGFFVKNGAPGSGAPDLTNTFVGSVIVKVGESITNQLPIGYSLLGSPIPYAGNLAIIGQNGGDTNIDFGGPLAKQAQLLTWNLAGQSYTTVTKGGTPALWGGTVPISVGQGFFVNNKNGPVTNVVQTLAP